jgi:GT2 family glycosyltransferase
MRLSVIILNWNSTAATIRRVKQVTQWHRLAPTIWVVDNASAKGDVDQISLQCPGARLLRSAANLGFAGGNNLAIKAALEAGSHVMLLLNNDAEIDEAGVTSLMQVMEATPALGIIGPIVNEFDGHRSILYAGGRNIAFHLNTHVQVASPPSQAVCAADYVPGAVVLVRRDVFVKVGLLDERYFFSGEIADLCLRARRCGFECGVVTRVIAQHNTHLADDRRKTLYAYYSLRNRLLYVRKFHSWSLLIWSFIYWGMATRNLLVGRLAAARVIWLAWSDGIRGNYGNRNVYFGFT